MVLMIMPVATAIFKLSTTPFISILSLKSQDSSVFCRNPLDSPPIIKVKNVSRIINLLKKNDYWIYGATDQALEDVNNIDFKFPLALVIGGESKGLRQKTLESCDFQLKINMKGVVESLNMAVATGIIINTMHSKIK
jgi:tRNA G18 (ribose-2'-O)-methylase SpoU